MTDPDREHTQEPAEGADRPGADEATGRTPRSEEPAEGKDLGPGPADPPRDT
ncbi:MAG: hypothetical protein JWO98_4147 [Frankiales bacterium]|nr:hypothetical protein [Frankiales bacterium]